MLPLPENVQLGTFQLIYAQPEVCPQVVNRQSQVKSEFV